MSVCVLNPREKYYLDKMGNYNNFHLNDINGCFIFIYMDQYYETRVIKN